MPDAVVEPPHPTYIRTRPRRSPSIRTSAVHAILRYPTSSVLRKCKALSIGDHIQHSPGVAGVLGAFEDLVIHGVREEDDDDGGGDVDGARGDSGWGGAASRRVEDDGAEEGRGVHDRLQQDRGRVQDEVHGHAGGELAAHVGGGGRDRGEVRAPRRGHEARLLHPLAPRPPSPPRRRQRASRERQGRRLR
jgi:hypothetical protein